MQVRADYFPLTEASARANITVQLEMALNVPRFEPDRLGRAR